LPTVSDTELVNELVGSVPYRFEEKLDAQGRVHRFAKGRLGPLPARWQEPGGEWQENRRSVQLRDFVDGPLRRFYVAAEVAPEGNGSYLVLTAELECVGLLGMAARYSGIIGIAGRKRVAAVDRLVREAAVPGRVLGDSAEDQISGRTRRRLDELTTSLARDPASHGLTVSPRGISQSRPTSRCAVCGRWHWRSNGTAAMTRPSNCSSRRRRAASWSWLGICCARAAAAPRCARRGSTSCRPARIAPLATSTIGATSPAMSN
jgi:hypothetical protein